MTVFFSDFSLYLVFFFLYFVKFEEMGFLREKFSFDFACMELIQSVINRWFYQKGSANKNAVVCEQVGSVIL